MRHVTGAKAVSPQTMIQMIRDSATSKEAAVASLIAAANANTALHDYLIAKGASAAIGELIRNDNAKIFRDTPEATVAGPRLVMPEAPMVSGAHKRRLRATAATLQLMAITLPNGVRMADASRDDIANAIANYEPQAFDMLHKAAYYRAVLYRLPEGKRVAEVFDDAGLTALYESARPRQHELAA